jgi:alkane 1-monooxygenase
MSKNLYMHFTYEHLFGHHRRVATPEDPASSRQGENVYEFFIRSFTGSYRSVYEMESKEAKKPFFLNYAVLSVAAAIVFSAAVFYAYGFQTFVFFLLEAYLSIFYLEAINYIEHYGLFRKKLPNGEYEKVTIRHSWNAPHRFSNYILFKLQRHSDHHENSLKPYQTLLSLDESPHLPHGYSLIIMLSFFPSEWRAIMDPLVEEYKKVGVENIETEVTTKAIALTKKFAIKLGVAVIGCYAFSLLHFI